MAQVLHLNTMHRVSKSGRKRQICPSCNKEYDAEYLRRTHRHKCGRLHGNATRGARGLILAMTRWEGKGAGCTVVYNSAAQVAVKNCLLLQATWIRKMRVLRHLQTLFYNTRRSL